MYVIGVDLHHLACKVFQTWRHCAKDCSHWRGASILPRRVHDPRNWSARSNIFESCSVKLFVGGQRRNTLLFSCRIVGPRLPYNQSAGICLHKVRSWQTTCVGLRNNDAVQSDIKPHRAAGVPVVTGNARPHISLRISAQHRRAKCKSVHSKVSLPYLLLISCARGQVFSGPIGPEKLDLVSLHIHPVVSVKTLK